MKYDKLIIGGLLFLSFYTTFWLWFLAIPPHKNIVNIPKQQSAFASTQNNNLVLGASASQPSLPSRYSMPIESRRQYFNLSCEFAAASGIIFYFTNNPDFAVGNQAQAEKELIKQVWISRNPNVGIRMGMVSATSLDSLYVNLNKGFGGADYYGIHAPPFIDLFANYKLTAKPIYINDSTINSIQKAIFNGHLVMAWIKIGYASPIDDELSYGKIKIIRGEHSIIINGYDDKGVMVMDPGIGLERHIEYASLINAASLFPMPFLDVYKDVDNERSLDNLTVGFDSLTGIDRSIPKIQVRNGTDQTGAANQMRDILKDFGYNVNSVSKADNFDYQDIAINAKKNFSDFLYILNRDIKLADYVIASSSGNLAGDSDSDIVIIVGK